jgi:hypothetical protein
MRALVVYESMFGSTRIIAEAIAIGLSTQGVDVEVSEVGMTSSQLDDDIDLLVVGAPTHTFTLSRPETRSAAAEQATQALISTGIGLREWLDALPKGEGRAVAAFDTHADKRVPGSASRASHRRLRRRGYRAVLPAECFYVAGMQGPLVDGEVERARAWGAELAIAVQETGDAHASR